MFNFMLWCSLSLPDANVARRRWKLCNKVWSFGIPFVPVLVKYDPRNKFMMRIERWVILHISSLKFEFSY